MRVPLARTLPLGLQLDDQRALPPRRADHIPISRATGLVSLCGIGHLQVREEWQQALRRARWRRERRRLHHLHSAHALHGAQDVREGLDVQAVAKQAVGGRGGDLTQGRDGDRRHSAQAGDFGDAEPARALRARGMGDERRAESQLGFAVVRIERPQMRTGGGVECQLLGLTRRGVGHAAREGVRGGRRLPRRVWNIRVQDTGDFRLGREVARHDEGLGDPLHGVKRLRDEHRPLAIRGEGVRARRKPPRSARHIRAAPRRASTRAYSCLCFRLAPFRPAPYSAAAWRCWPVRRAVTAVIGAAKSGAGVVTKTVTFAVSVSELHEKVEKALPLVASARTALEPLTMKLHTATTQLPPGGG